MQNLYFGSKSEKSSRNKKKAKSNSSDSKQEDDQSVKDETDVVNNEHGSDSEITENANRTNAANKGVNSGKLSHHAYTNADYINLTTTHNVGGLCPQDCCGGKLTTLPQV